MHHSCVPNLSRLNTSTRSKKPIYLKIIINENARSQRLTEATNRPTDLIGCNNHTLKTIQSDRIVAGEFDESTPQDTGQASRTCQGRELMTLFLLNPSFDCRYQSGLNLFSWVHLGWINIVSREVTMHRVLADASIICAKAHAIQEKPSPWLCGSHHAILCRSDSQMCGF